MTLFARASIPVVLAVLLSAPAMAAPGGDAAEPRTLTVAGTGEVHATPDRATVTLGIQAREPTLDGARNTANQVVTRLLKAARELGVADAQIHSTRLSVNPEVNYNDQKHGHPVVAYTVQRQVIVDLRDIDRLGELLERGISAGANVAGEPVLDSSRRADLEREALAKAVADARANAQVLATALDAGVGAARAVSVGGTDAGRPFVQAPMAMLRAAAAPAPESYQSGELSFTASVTATFDLVPRATTR